MGDSHDAAAALKNHPRWVAVHENTLARIEVILAMVRAEWLSELDYESLTADLDGARRESQRARGVDMDAPPPACDHFWIERDGQEWCALCQQDRGATA